MALKFGSPAWRKKYAPKKRKNSKRRTTRRATARRTKKRKSKNPSAASTLKKIKALVRRVK